MEEVDAPLPAELAGGVPARVISFCVLGPDPDQARYRGVVAARVGVDGVVVPRVTVTRWRCGLGHWDRAGVVGSVTGVVAASAARWGGGSEG